PGPRRLRHDRDRDPRRALGDPHRLGFMPPAMSPIAGEPGAPAPDAAGAPAGPAPGAGGSPSRTPAAEGRAALAPRGRPGASRRRANETGWRPARRPSPKTSGPNSAATTHPGIAQTGW